MKEFLETKWRLSPCDLSIRLPEQDPVEMSLFTVFENSSGAHRPATAFERKPEAKLPAAMVLRVLFSNGTPLTIAPFES